jgi:glutamyl/glutaminyl-tRNA synthetase
MAAPAPHSTLPGDLPPGGRTRLAPTPSGYLHAGNALNFILAHKLARLAGARLLLRIDDLDADRARAEYLDDIFQSLAWLGITWDEGPKDPDDHWQSWSQALRLDRYMELVEALRRAGHLYACSCTRSSLRQASNDGRYPGTCRDRGLPFDGPDMAWRLHVPEGTTVVVHDLWGRPRSVDLARAMGDPVLRQRSGMPAYQVASLADDLDRTVTFVVRGADLLPSTACQLYIASLLGLSDRAPGRYLHHGLLTNADGTKLSKSAGAGSLLAMRTAGQGPEALWEAAERTLSDHQPGS